MALPHYNEPAPLETFPSLRSAFENSRTKKEGIVRALTFISHAFDKPLTDELFEAYEQGLFHLSEDQIAFGMSNCVRQCGKFPTCDMIEALSGSPTAADSAQDALSWLLGYIRLFGADGKPRHPVYQDVEVEGRLQNQLVKPAELPPDIPPLLLRALTVLGCGHPKSGLEMLRTHPSLSSWDVQAGMEPMWVTEKIEGRFNDAFRRARMGHGAIAAPAHKVRAIRAARRAGE